MAERARDAVARGEGDTEVLELLEENVENALAAKTRAGDSARRKTRAERNRRGGKKSAA